MWREVSAFARVDHVAVGGVWGTCGQQVGARAEARIHEALLRKALVGLGIEVATLALIVRCVRSAVAAAFVVGQPQPTEVVFELVGILAFAALRIEVFDA